MGAAYIKSTRAIAIRQNEARKAEREEQAKTDREAMALSMDTEAALMLDLCMWLLEKREWLLPESVEYVERQASFYRSTPGHRGTTANRRRLRRMERAVAISMSRAERGLPVLTHDEVRARLRQSGRRMSKRWTHEERGTAFPGWLKGEGAELPPKPPHKG